MEIVLSALLFVLAVILFAIVRLGIISSHTLQLLANIAAVLAAVAAIVVGPLSHIYGKSLQVTAPENGAETGQYVAVEGNTEYMDASHYIVVKTQAGDAWVTDGPLLVHEDGRWEGQAKLGTENVGHGEVFLIYVIATNNALSIGPVAMQQVDNAKVGIATVQVRRY